MNTFDHKEVHNEKRTKNKKDTKIKRGILVYNNIKQPRDFPLTVNKDFHKKVKIFPLTVNEDFHKKKITEGGLNGYSINNIK